jgi:hypothetical protein
MSLVEDQAGEASIVSGPLLQTTATVLGFGILFFGVLPNGLLAMARRALAALLYV